MSWVCKFCSTNNDDSSTNCFVCDAPKTVPVCTLTAKRVKDLGLTGDVVIPPEFNVIGEDAFRARKDITTVTVHSGVTKISQNAFYGCSNLRSVHCEGVLEYIASKAFYDCTLLPAFSRPKAERVASDAFGVSPPPPPPPPPPKVSAPTSTYKSTTKTHGIGGDYSTSTILGVKIISLMVLIGVPVLILSLILDWLSGIMSYEWWEAITGVVGAIAVMYAMLIIAVAFNIKDVPLYLSICIVFVWLVNLLLLLLFEEDYLIVSSIITAVGALGSVCSAIYCYTEIENVYGTINIGFAILNVVTFIRALIYF